MRVTQLCAQLRLDGSSSLNALEQARFPTSPLGLTLVVGRTRGCKLVTESSLDAHACGELLTNLGHRALALSELFAHLVQLFADIGEGGLDRRLGRLRFGAQLRHVVGDCAIGDTAAVGVARASVFGQHPSVRVIGVARDWGEWWLDGAAIRLSWLRRRACARARDRLGEHLGCRREALRWARVNRRARAVGGRGMQLLEPQLCIDACVPSLCANA
mmetsp:Transcript_17615/g.53288  ORF Transcript_17615/g.53288 Transcript_17615/m.53288 type:complete len:216 (+) Transcript_17615:964-1611(+)